MKAFFNCGLPRDDSLSENWNKYVQIYKAVCNTSDKAFSRQYATKAKDFRSFFKY